MVTDKALLGLQMTAKPPEYEIRGSVIKQSHDLGHGNFDGLDLITLELFAEIKNIKTIQGFIMLKHVEVDEISKIQIKSKEKLSSFIV